MPKGKAASSSDSNSPLRPPTSLEAQRELNDFFGGSMC